MSESESSSSGSPRFADFDRWQAQTGLKSFGEGLKSAARAIFPSRIRKPYSNVYVLMLCWDEEGKDSIPADVTRLSGLLEDVFQYDVNLWTIPSENSQDKVIEKVTEFINLGKDSKDDLKIVYYLGDASLNKERRSVWTRLVL